MQAKQNDAQRWPILDDVIGPLTDWWRRHAEVRDSLSELDDLAPEELARVATDVGMPASELRTLAQHGPDAADLLEYRLKSLGLDADELARTVPGQLRDMRRLCTMCEYKGRCARDLVADSSDPVWLRYCPNDETLAGLQREAAAT